MLSPADADVVRRETALPGLAILLDAERFAAELARARPRLGCRSARLTQLRYQPGAKCLAAYRVETDGEALDVYARAGASSRDEAPAAPRPRAEGPASQGPFALPGTGVAACVFPRDAKLSRLSRLGSAAERRKLLSRLLPQRRDLWNSGLERLRYKPEQRCVYRVRGPAGDAALKLYAAHGFRSARARLGVLASRAPLRLPATLGVHLRYRATAVEWLDGEPLRGLLAHPDAPLTPLEEVGAALQRLHDQTDAPLEARTPEAERRRLRAAGDALGFLQPALAPRIERLLAAVAEVGAWGPGSAALHGDFYSKQVLLGAGEVGVIDLDQAGRGRPEVDLGLFLAHLERDRRLGRLAPGRATAAGEGLLQGYQKATGAPLAAGPLAGHAAGALLRLASYPFRRRLPDWPARVDDLLAGAEQLLARAKR